MALMYSIVNKRFSRLLLLLIPFLLCALAVTTLWSHLKLHGDDVHRTIFPWLRPEKPEKPEVPEFYPFETTSQFFPVSQDIAGKTAKDLCASFPSYLTQRIQPVLKMGHGEKRDKVEAQLDSVSACFRPEELLVFSDLDETIRDRTVIDILADLPASYSVDNPDFDDYRTLRQMRLNRTLDVDLEATASIDGWRLDKFKFVPMIERAWAMRPGRDWYVFYETDTYVVWDNMFRFLSTLDPARPLYMGSPSPGRTAKAEKKGAEDVKTWFANGGPGFVLSRAAIEKLVTRRSAPDGRYLDPPLSLKWFDLLRSDSCGDSVVGWLMWDMNVPVSGYWPMFNPHSVHSVPYSDTYWCQPVLTLHKTTPEDMVELWRWEHSRRQKKAPLLYQDLYDFRHPGSPAAISDWDNGGWATFAPPADAPQIDSFETCGAACEASQRCVQWLWRGQDAKECILMSQIRYGAPRAPETLPDLPDDEEGEGAKAKEPRPKPKPRKASFKSGWLTGRIDKWREDKKCKAAQWVGPSIERVF